MKIQSLSVVVPATGCINNCKFCVSHMRVDNYKNNFDLNLPFYDLYQADYLKRLAFARDNGCNTVMLTGNSEPQQNREFLRMFGILNQQLDKPFRWIEMQTTGVLLDDGYLRFLRNHVGVSTISISLSSFDSATNADICGMPPRQTVDIEALCSLIKKYDFNLRLSLNMTYGFNDLSPEEILDAAKELGADQVTFRKLYTSGADTEQDRWIKGFALPDRKWDEIVDYILHEGRKLERLEYGAMKYSINGMSVVYDDDCMATDESKSEYKYLILRPNCKLYSKWDDKGSLIF